MHPTFDQWNSKKQSLDEQSHRPPFVSEGDIWWVSIGKNIGSEVNGKSQKFSRPGIIYKKLAHGFYLIIPTTTKSKVGSWYVKFRQHGSDAFACLHQIRTIEYRRLYSKLGSLDDKDRENVRQGFMKLYT